MPKHLREIVDTTGIKSSTIEPMNLPDDLQPNKDGKDFVNLHKVEKHADRVGNKDDVYKGTTKKVDMKRHGPEDKVQKKING